MGIESIQKPEWIEDYCVGKTKLSECIDKYEYSWKGEFGYIYFCRPWPGVLLWANDVYMHRIPTEQLQDYHFIKLNYCMKGRCEVLLTDERYVYLEDGILSLDSNSPKDFFIYPNNRYTGLELVLDMHQLKEQPIRAFEDCGISIEELGNRLSSMQGSYLAATSGEWRQLADELIENLQNARGRAEDYRFWSLQLLYLLCRGSLTPLEKKRYLTRGQRMIVVRVEELISSDLKCHYTAEELAKSYKISPSSLKKYFEQVHGMPISEYLRQKRMELACRMLSETKSSVADIAAEAGYSNQGKFSSAFKRYTGKTPLEYRRLQGVD